ncbi:hypothetical protein Dsin_028067 [Dipteronia sinensis]|uniref:Homeobox domain-containing protein n=1 Tax=Dipteronia sinensis TaxID=43782 RepID=A0AAD9ZRC9_9ROSI|nr:hypothetical protein Dsin_028067 [Dipteronia sinensis]
MARAEDHEALFALKKYTKYASSPQNCSHVPEFGSWDRNNVRYTTYFEDARKAKAVEKMNPDDLEASVNNGTGGLDNPLDANSDKNNSAEKSSCEGGIGRNPQERKIYNQLKSASNRSGTSESGSDISNSDHSLRQSGQLHLKSDRKIGRSEGSSKHSRKRSGSNRSDESAHHRREVSASVPKFGDWDENDAKSSEGFTAIFEKLKEEKQIASTNILAIPPPPYTYSDTPKNNRGSSYKSKLSSSIDTVLDCSVIWYGFCAVLHYIYNQATRQGGIFLGVQQEGLARRRVKYMNRKIAKKERKEKNRTYFCEEELMLPKRKTRPGNERNRRSLALADSTGLDSKQINNWFINQRKRHWKPSEDMQVVVMDSAHMDSVCLGNLLPMDISPELL